MAYLPDHKLTVAVVGNRGWLWSTDLGVPIVRALLGQAEPPRLRREAISADERRALASVCDDGLFDFKIDARRRDVRVTVAPFGAPIELWKQAPGVFVAALRPDTFRLTLARRRHAAAVRLDGAPLLPSPVPQSRSKTIRLNKAPTRWSARCLRRTLCGKGRRTMRSKLFVPGSRAELFAKALAGAADAISFDVEDSVPEDSKARAREQIADFLRSGAVVNR